MPKRPVTVLALVLVALIGVVDYRTGWEIHVTAFYLLPIGWACWTAGRRTGIFVAIIATAVMLVSDVTSGYAFQHPAIPYWNSLMMFAFFAVVVYLLSAFQTAHYHLEEIVQQRTAALQAEIAERKRLEAAKLQAERLAVIGTMAAKVAHEIRNPLGSITLNLDLVSKEIEKFDRINQHSLEESRVLLQDIRDETKRIKRVIDDYLQFARLPKLQRRPLALNEFLDQKLAFMHATLEDASVELRTEFDPALTIVNADAEQFWQVVLNLLRNSREAMPRGGELCVSTQRDDAQAIVRVTDTGDGMTEEQARQVFHPFFSTKTQGTGLGLALAQQIIIEHGGHIECESAPGQGSAFTIYLPLAEKS
jgi:signal transduction histidine kinase